MTQTSVRLTQEKVRLTQEKLDLTEIASRNPQVDLELLRRAQEETKRLGIEPATYNLEGAFARRLPSKC